MHSPGISAVLTDIDGTLVTKDKVLTERALASVEALRQHGVMFTVTSGRPPFGMRMLVEPLGLTLPMAAYNGGVIVLPDLSVLDERLVPEYLVPAIIDMIEWHGLDVFLFRTNDWAVRSLSAPRVARETSNIRQSPIVVQRFDEMVSGVAKIVGVSEDHPRVAACEAAIQSAFGTQVSAARSQAHYLDITHPSANKGVVIERLARYLMMPLESFAAVGDQANDTLMFERSGISIAMGNASDDVKRRATYVTSSYADEGFANAIEQFVLPRAEPARGPSVKPTGRLHRLGQSLWIDDFTRDLYKSGTLDSYLDELSVSGLSSSPHAFTRALKKSRARDVPTSLRHGGSAEEQFFDLALADLTRAADLLRPIYERSAGMDGWVSLDVSPFLSRDVDATLAASQALLSRARRPNLMLEIPGLSHALTAIEEATFAGMPINVTLLFSREHYLAAAEAFLQGTERRLDAGLRPDVTSVASVSVAPWDAAVADRVPDDLQRRLGLAMAQRTYKAYRGLIHSPRWQRVYNAGARTQRIVWSGIPSLDYVAALTAPFTVVSMSESTLRAFADHGEVTTLLPADGGRCEETLAQFMELGVDFYALADELQQNGVRELERSWRELLTALAARTSSPRAGRHDAR